MQGRSSTAPAKVKYADESQTGAHEVRPCNEQSTLTNALARPYRTINFTAANTSTTARPLCKARCPIAKAPM